MGRKKQIYLRIAIAIIAGFALTGWLSSEKGKEQLDYLGKVHQNIIFFGKVYKEVANKYIDVIDPEKFMNLGLDAMLAAVDDYTVLVEGEENAQLEIMTTGRYGGLGMVIGIREKWPTVMEPPYDDTPALRAGCREGDQIIEVDGISTENMTVNDVAKHMRGEIGTAVNISIRRAGSDQPINFRLVRAEIVVKDVVFSEVIADSVGYIKLSRFSKNAVHEVRKSVLDLKNKGMKNLILDLRNNPGGLLESAVGVADIFLAKGRLIVSTKGRTPATMQKYYSENDPILVNEPLVILVNRFSASASEIVAGAIQDLDRGIILGQTTFGKGLVQSIIQLNRNSRLKLTTAKYYLPSGRLIQRDRRTPKEKEKILFSAAERQSRKDDSLKVYSTTIGREVHGRGGIVPDMVIAADSLTGYQQSLLRQSMIFNYAVDFINTLEQVNKIPEVTDAVLADFELFLQQRKFKYESESYKKLTELKNILKVEGYLDKTQPQMASLDTAINNLFADEFSKNKDFIQHQLNLELAAKYGGTQAKIRIGLTKDEELKKALNLLQNLPEFSSILQPESEI
ncbi:MAG: S41 family peptidase [Calditrichaeota bacterium]|nr:MAG: S41 family peptidase [Calditrichota bacterium]